MQYWCPAPLPSGEDPCQKLRSKDYQPLAAGLLKKYLSDSSVGADKDSDQDVGGDVTSRPAITVTAKPTC
jgi:hypothetical protein